MSDLNLQVTNPGIGAMSAYAYFVQIIREEHKKKHPGEQIVFSEFSKKCAEKWKTMTPKERKRFEEMAVADKERFSTQTLTNYAPPDSGKKRRKRRHKDPNQPKRAWSAFFFFCDEHRPKIRAEHPDWRVGQVAKVLGSLWEECKDKTQYETMSQKDKERYEEEMNQFRAGTYVPTPKAARVYNGTQAHENEDDEEEEEDGASKGESTTNGTTSIPPPNIDTAIAPEQVAEPTEMNGTKEEPAAVPVVNEPAATAEVPSNEEPVVSTETPHAEEKEPVPVVAQETAEKEEEAIPVTEGGDENPVQADSAAADI